MFIDTKIRTPEWEKTVKDFLSYLKNTSNSDWCLDVVRTPDNKNCLVGHFYNFYEQNYPNSKKDIFSYFEDIISPATHFFKINDGSHPDYTQPTPKERCITYIENILTGYELTTYEQMEKDFLKSRGLL